MQTLLHTLPLILVASVSLAQTPFETPPTIRATDLVPAGILKGKDYSVDPDVPTDGFVGTFYLRSRFGDYECIGREMLYTRISELSALEELERVSRTKAFLDAMAGAAVEPVKAAVKIVTKPVTSVKSVPSGIAHLFKQVGQGFADTGKAIGKLAKSGNTDHDQPKPPPGRDDPFGYNQIRNEWARKLAVDPYTTNRVLAVKLNYLANIGFSTDKVTGIGVGYALGGMGVIANYVSYLPDIDDHLLTAPPADVTEVNTRRLKELGVSKEDMQPLFDSGWFSPTLQTRFVNALARLRGVSGLGNETRLAGTVRSEEQARFICGSLEMLERYHTGTGPLREVSTHAGLPSGVTQDGTLVVAVPVDLLSWTQTASDFATPQQGQNHAVLCESGLLTQRAQEGFENHGWKVLQMQSLY